MMLSLRSAAQRCAARAVAAVPSRPFTQAARLSSVMFPPDLPTRKDEYGNRWADYRPEVLRNLTATRNAEGDMVGQFQGEEVIFPDLDSTLEWTLSSPVDLHLFEEAPIIKMYEEESELDPSTQPNLQKAEDEAYAAFKKQ